MNELKTTITLRLLTSVLLCLMTFLVSAQWTPKGQNLNGETVGDLFGQPTALSENGQVLALNEQILKLIIN